MTTILEVTPPLWLSTDDVIALHAQQLALYGGPEGLRDRGGSSRHSPRPINRIGYECHGALAVLAAEYAFGIARNHPFVDGNKRTAFTAMMVFLRLNGVRFAPDPAEATAAILALAAGDLDVDELSRWITDRWPDTR